jgi:hypothetical protein
MNLPGAAVARVAIGRASLGHHEALTQLVHPARRGALSRWAARPASGLRGQTRARTSRPRGIRLAPKPSAARRGV